MDIVAAALAVVFFQFLFESWRIDGDLNWLRLIFDSFAGVLSYAIGLLAVRSRGGGRRLANTFFGVLIGGCLWIILKTLKGIVLDWDFLASHPDRIYVRHLGMAIKAAVILLPIMTVVTLSFIGVLRLIRKALTPKFS
jgi:hypothetical protein